MRLSLFFLFICVFHVAAINCEAQNVTINLKSNNLTVGELIKEIEKQTDYLVVYSHSEIDTSKKINVQTKSGKVMDFLNSAFKGSNVNHIFDNDYIILKSKSIDGIVQDTRKKVTGVVKDENGEPLIGVSVAVKGTTLGVMTDIDGKYTIDAPTDGELTFSYVGMNAVTEKINNRTVINVGLTDNSIVLQNVVVTALGIKREEKALGYAVQKVDGDVLRTVKGVDVATSLTGKVAGLKIANSTEFAEAPEMTLRGEKPILVIDGVPYANMTMRDVPADDIEDISVLKGATASALYGSRGKGGAIMITTKKGSENKGVSVSFNSNTMFSAGYLAIPETQSTFGRGTSGKYDRNADRVWGQVMDGTMIEQWNPISKSLETMPYLPVGKNNFKNFVRSGYITNNSLSVTQQGELGSLRASGSWVHNKGLYPNSMFDKYSFGVGGEMKYDRFSASATMTYNRQASPNAGFNGYTNYDPMYSLLLWTGADYDVRDYRDFWLVKEEKQNNSYGESTTLDNPYFQQHARTRSIDKDIINASVSLGYDILPWVKATVRSGMDFYSDRQDVKISRGNYTSSGNNYGWSPKLKGLYSTKRNTGWSSNTDAIVSVNRTFGQFSLDSFIGGSISYEKNENMYGATNDGISIPGYFSLAASVKDKILNSGIKSKQINSVYGKVGGSWNSTVYLEGTLRNDWSSTLPDDTRSYLYPSVAGSFIFSEVLPKYDWLSMWKGRASWAMSKKPADIYETNVAYTIANSVWGGLTSAVLPREIRSVDLNPQNSATFEIGTMAMFLKNRLSVDFAYFNIRDYDFIKKAPVSQASGYSSNYINIGEEITTKGFEFTINATPIKTADWTWNVNTNWTRYARYYTKIDDQFSSQSPWVKKGKRADHFTLRDFMKSPDGQIIHDSNGLPMYSNYDSVYGYSDPDWIWGVGTNLRYKNFTLALSFDGRIGGKTSSITEAYMWISGAHPNSVTPERFKDVEAAIAGNGAYAGSFVSQGVVVTSGSATYDLHGNILTDDRVYGPNTKSVLYKSYTDRIHKGFVWGGSASPLDVYSTTFFKLREVSLTYDIPADYCKKLLCKSASVSLVGQNVLLWAKDFKYSDPDGGKENLSDPSVRYLGFNVKLNF